MIATCVIFAEVDAVATVKTPVDAEDKGGEEGQRCADGG